KEALSEQGNRYLDRARHASNRMHKLIETVYFYTRLDSAEEAIKEACDLGEVLEHAKDNIDALIRETNTRIVADALATVHANRMQLLQVLQNLLTNAIQHCDQVPVI